MKYYVLKFAISGTGGISNSLFMELGARCDNKQSDIFDRWLILKRILAKRLNRLPVNQA